MTQRLCDPLPYTVEFEGKTLEITPYFDNVLDVLSVFDDTSRTEEEKVMYAFVDRNPEPLSTIGGPFCIYSKACRKTPA